MAGELSGVNFPIEQIVLNPAKNKQGQLTFQGRVYYKGPLGSPNFSRIIFDITQQEKLADTPADLSIFHPYGDAPEQLPKISTYSLNELIAEKMRALFERTRPRDLYDVVYLLENRIDQLNLNQVRAVFQQKCVFKQIEPPNVEQLIQKVSADSELRSEWANMLAHQLPSLPDVEDFVARLSTLITWLDRPEFVPIESTLQPAAAMSEDQEVLAPAGIRYWGGGLPLETIRFAGANRLLLGFQYNGKQRLVEPYSVRRARTTGNILLYAWELSSQQIKAFKIPEMFNAKPTNTSFSPRYKIELNSQGPVTILPVESRPRITTPYSGRAPRSRTSYGPTYIVQCTYCQKRFRRTSYDTSLNKHKTPEGWDCPGRIGYLVDTVY